MVWEPIKKDENYVVGFRGSTLDIRETYSGGNYPSSESF